MLLEAPRSPLRPADLPEPQPGPGQVLIRVHACGVCRTDLHVVDGELPDPKLPLVLGHQIVGTVDASARDVELRAGHARRRAVARLDVRHLPLLPRPVARTCATRPASPATTLDGGYAEHVVADERFCFAMPGRLPRSPGRAAALRRPDRLSLAAVAGDAERLGLYGFGAAAHIVAQVARWQGRRVFAFTRPGDDDGAGVRALARRRLGRRLRRGAAGAARRGDHLRAGRRARAGRAGARSRRAASSSAAGST